MRPGSPRGASGAIVVAIMVDEAHRDDPGRPGARGGPARTGALPGRSWSTRRTGTIACVAIAQPRARCLNLAMRMAKTYVGGVFLDSGASASIMSQGHPKALGPRCSLDWVPASGFASRLRRNLGRNLRPHKSAPRKPSLWKCFQLLEDSQPGRVKGDGGLNVLGLLDLLDLLDPT